jgi:hypothetical protein
MEQMKQLMMTTMAVAALATSGLQAFGDSNNFSDTNISNSGDQTAVTGAAESRGQASGDTSHAASSSATNEQSSSLTVNVKQSESVKQTESVNPPAVLGESTTAPAASTPAPASAPEVLGGRGAGELVAFGPVEAGDGSTAGLQNVSLLVGGTTLVVLAGAILFARRRLPSVRQF